MNDDDHEAVTDKPPRLGRHGTASVEPWHLSWLSIRGAFKHVRRLSESQRQPVAGPAREHENLRALALHAAFAEYPTSDLDLLSRGRWIATCIRAAAKELYATLSVPLRPEAAADHAILFWYLYLCLGYSPQTIARRQASFITPPLGGNILQLVKARMWAGTARPPRKANRGLERLHAAITVRLASGAIVADAPAPAAWDISFAFELQSLDQEQPPAIDALRVMSFVDSTPLPTDILTTGWRTLPVRLRNITRDPTALQALIDTIGRTGLLTVTDRDTLAMPAVVQQFIRRTMTLAGQRRYATYALRMLDEALHDDAASVHSWPLWRSGLSHVLAAAEHGERLDVDVPTTARLLNNAAVFLLHDHQPSRALELCERAVALTEKAFAHKPDELAIPLSDLAYILSELDRLPEALEIHERVNDLVRSATGESDDYAMSLNMYGNTLRRAGRTADAEHAQRHALRIVDAQPIGEILNDLSITLGELGKDREAAELLEQALPLLWPDGKFDHAMLNYGNTLRRLGVTARARVVLENTLLVRECLYGECSYEVSTTLHYLAELLAAANDASVEDIQARALAIEDQLGLTRERRLPL
jgi:tetratricopeptide (TPR) repeat protein